MTLKVSVIVVTKNEERRICNCLSSLINQDYPRDAYEVILVDAGSDDGTRKIALEFPVMLIVDNYGTLGHQRNTGVNLSHGEYVAFIDADCRADKHWLSRQIEVLDKSPPEVVAVTGPNLIMKSDPPLAKTIAYIQQTLIGSGGSPQSYHVKKELASVISAPNCNAVYRRQLLLEHPYDNYFNCGEDAELNYRLRREGYKFLYNSKAVVGHHRVGTFKELAKKMFAWGNAMARIAKKHRNPIRWYAWLPPIFLLFLVLFPFISFLNMLYPWAFDVLASYAMAISLTTIKVLIKQRCLYAILTAFLLPVQHISYGMGILSGLLKRG